MYDKAIEIDPKFAMAYNNKGSNCQYLYNNRNLAL